MFVNALILIALILINAFFAATEIALLSVNPNKVKQKSDEGYKRAISLKKAIDDPNRFLATIQIGISLVGLFSGAFTAQAFSSPVVEYLISAGVSVSPDVLKQIVIIGLTVVLSFFVLVFGELVPKRIAMQNAYEFSAFVINIVIVLEKLAIPFVKLSSFTTNCVLKLFGVDINDKEEDITEEEIRMMVDVGGTTGSIDEDEKEMINNVFEFDNKTAEDVAIHRKDIVALPIDATRRDIIETATVEKYSRILIYEENIDNIVGVLHIKDLLSCLFGEENTGNREIDLKSIIRKPYFVPVSKKTDELFEEMQKNKVQMAVVVDEYGGTAGIVTMEDLIEEVMGNILDEYDEEEQPDIQTIDTNTFLIQGTADLDTVSEFFDISLPVDDYDTVSGFIIAQIGRIPLEGEQPEVEFDGLIFKVDTVEEKRIATVIVCKAE